MSNDMVIIIYTKDLQLQCYSEKKAYQQFHYLI